MPNDLSQLDAATAWRPYAADKERPWNRARAAHLFRRAGFGATSRELDEAVKQEPAEVVKRLLIPAPGNAEFERQFDELGRTMLAGGNPESLSAWWLYRMAYTPDPLLEKSTLFWHGHFATSAAKVTDAKTMLNQNDLLRQHARGDFAALVHKMSRDPAMLLYLDSASNRKTHPNENFARELMELFCLGLGNYTERDIKQVAPAALPVGKCAAARSCSTSTSTTWGPSRSLAPRASSTATKRSKSCSLNPPPRGSLSASC